MRNLIIVFAIAFALGHYWKEVVKFINSKLNKKK